MACHDRNAPIPHAAGQSSAVSRRELLRHGAAAVIATGAAAVIGRAPVLAQVPPGNPAALATFEAERQAAGKTAGLRFRALVRYDNSLTMETLTLLPIHPLQVIVRNVATQTCYSTTSTLTTTPAMATANVAGHGGVGIVEEIGSQVKRVKVGDRVVIAITPNCGVCGNCLNGRGDICSTRLPNIPAATMDGRAVVMTAGPSAYSEYVVSYEDWLVPVWTQVSAAELAIISCVGATGLGLATCRFPIESGSDVAVFGLGPIGISAVQGARIQGAKTVIGVDPIRYRRDLAMKLGATHVFDPNVDRGNDLVTKIQALTTDDVPDGRRFVGERASGPMYSLEAVGGTRHPLAPGVEAPLDLTGIEALQQAWTVTRNGGYVRTCSIGHPQGSTVSFPSGQWSNGSKTHVPGNYAGVQALRDIPRFIRLVERGQFDAKSLVGRTFGPDKMKEALEVAADRSAITSIIEF